MSRWGLLSSVSSRKLAIDLVLNSLHLLLLPKLLLAQRFAEREVIVLETNGKEGAAFPATVRPLIAGLNQGHGALSLT